MSGKERVIAAALLAAIAGCAGFIAAYATGGSRLFEGLSLALTSIGFCAAALGWAFWIVPDERVCDEIETYPQPEAERAIENGEVRTIERELTPRSAVLMRLLGAALTAFVAALVVPMRSLGPAFDKRLFHTQWRAGSRLTRPDGSFVHAGDLEPGNDVIVFPEGWIGDSQSQTTLIRLADRFAPRTQGYLAYSRLCTHAGCPVALFRAATRQLMCPCHQSVFDAAAAGRVVSGPADHALPELPIVIDADGVLRATGDFPQPVGPGFWERA